MLKNSVSLVRRRASLQLNKHVYTADLIKWGSRPSSAPPILPRVWKSDLAGLQLRSDNRVISSIKAFVCSYVQHRSLLCSRKKNTSWKPVICFLSSFSPASEIKLGRILQPEMQNTAHEHICTAWCSSTGAYCTEGKTGADLEGVSLKHCWLQLPGSSGGFCAAALKVWNRLAYNAADTSLVSSRALVS